MCRSLVIIKWFEIKNCIIMLHFLILRVVHDLTYIYVGSHTLDWKSLVGVYYILA